MNETREKILLLLVGGVALLCANTSRKQNYVLKAFSREWAKIDKKEINNGIKYLYKLGYVEKQKGNDNIFKVIPTKKGKLKILDNKLENLKLKKEKWDKKWRMVSFDIPEKYKNGRDVLRRKLKKVGFCELQKSVLITPYDCKEEIFDLVKHFELDKYVRFGVLEFVDNELYLKKVFKLD